MRSGKAFSRISRQLAEFARNRRYYGLPYALRAFCGFLVSFFVRHVIRREPFSAVPDDVYASPAAERAEALPDTCYVERLAASVPPDAELVFYIHLIISLGDIVACEPVVRYLKARWQGAKVVWIVRKGYEAVLKCNPFIAEVRTVANLAESSALLASLDVAKGQVAVDLHFNGLRCPDTGFIHHNAVNPFITFETYLHCGNLLEAFSLCAGMEVPDEPPVFYLDPAVRVPQKLPERYVVFHCKSNMRIKDWTARKWNALALRLLRLGYTVVELGTERIIRTKSGRYVDCTDIADLQEIAAIISRAECFVGIDSGFAHIANCFGVKSVLIFGVYYHYSDYRIYSGGFGKGENCRIVFDHRYGSFRVRVKDVERAFIELIG